MQSIKKMCIAASVGLAATLASVTPAQAAIYTGHWDPDYGSAFPDLGWEGNATFSIPDACLARSGWVSNVDDCSGGGMKILSAEVSFYSLSSSPTFSESKAMVAPTNIVETLTFDPNVAVYKMYVSGNQLQAVSSNFLGPVQATSSIAGGGAYYFDLKFFESTSNNVGLYHTLGYADPLCAYTGVPAGCGMSSSTPTMTLSLVPEPSTLALALLGLTGLLGLRRRNG